MPLEFGQRVLDIGSVECQIMWCEDSGRVVRP